MTVPTGTTPFLDEPVPQGDGSTLQWKNCMPATAACNVGRATVGKLRRTGSQIRAASPTAASADRGMLYSETVAAVVRSTTGKDQVIPEARFGIGTADLKALCDAGHSGLISIDCSVTVDTERTTNKFTGGHAIGWYDYAWRVGGECFCERHTTVDHGEYKMEDPGTTIKGYQWWSSTLLYRAALSRTGGHGVHVIVFPDTEDRSIRCFAAGVVRAKATIESPKVTSLVVGATYSSVATVNGQGWKRADGGTANGWYKVKLGTGKFGYIRGDKAR